MKKYTSIRRTGFDKHDLPLSAKKASLWQASAIMICGSVIVNAGNYLFALVNARLLGPDGYGTLAAIFSVIAITGLAGTTGSLLAMRSVAQFAPDKWGMAWNMRQHFFTIMRRYTGAMALLFILISFYLIHALTLNIYHVVAMFIITYLSTVLAIERGFIQGMQKFSRVLANMLLEITIKLISVGLILVARLALNLSDTWVLSLILASFAISMTISGLLIWKQSWRHQIDEIQRHDLPSFSYINSTAISLLALAILMNADVLVAKSTLSIHEAGQMAALAKMGQIVFFSTAPIIGAMFPMISEHYDKGTKHVHLLLRAIILSVVISGLILGFINVFPHLTVSFLFGSQYVDTAPLLSLMGYAMMAFTIGNLYVSYFLSIKESRFVILLWGVTALHILLLLLYHNSLEQIVAVDAASFSILAVSSLIWYIVGKRKGLKYLTRLDERLWRLLFKGIGVEG